MEKKELKDDKGDLRGQIVTTKYTAFICSDSVLLLLENVETFEEKGWRLLGPIVVTPTPNDAGEIEGVLSATLKKE